MNIRLLTYIFQNIWVIFEHIFEYIRVVICPQRKFPDVYTVHDTFIHSNPYMEWWPYHTLLLDIWMHINLTVRGFHERAIRLHTSSSASSWAPFETDIGLYAVTVH